MKISIIGGGPAGISCGYALSKADKEVSVYEGDTNVGGMAKSFDLWGQRVDLGPHRFFSKQKEINDFFTAVIQNDYTLINRQTRIFYNEKYFDYPIKLGNVFKNLPLSTIIQVLWYYFIQRIRPIKNPKNFEEWVTNRFGKKLFEIFFKHYTEKLWGIKCTEIDADWAAQRIKSLSLFGAVMAALFGNKGNKHKTLVDQFAYPKNGTGSLYEKAADQIRANNGEIKLDCGVKRVILNQNNTKVNGIELNNGEFIPSDIVVSTMPIDNLIRGFDDVPKDVHDAVDAIYFRNTILVYLEIDKKDLFPDNWLYIHSPNVKHGRMTNFRNWCPSLNKDKETTILCMEYWCFDKDEIWTQAEEKLISQAKKEVYKTKLIPKEAKILNAKQIKIPKSYPVYETGYQKHMTIIIDYLKGIKGLIPIGRYGAFKYNNQDHSILMGLLAAQNIIENKNIDLWKINTDIEYQEEGKIKDVLHQ
jgi:protoporphyrinogen oxidase